MLEMIALDAPGTRRSEDLRIVEPGDGGWRISLAVVDIPIRHSRHSKLFGYAEERLLTDIDPGAPFGTPMVPEPAQDQNIFSVGSKPKAIVLRFLLLPSGETDTDSVSVSREQVHFLELLDYDSADERLAAGDLALEEWRKAAACLETKFAEIYSPKTEPGRLNADEIATFLALQEQTVLAAYFQAQELPGIYATREDGTDSYGTLPNREFPRLRITGALRRFDGLFNLSLLVDKLDEVKLRYHRDDARRFVDGLNKRATEREEQHRGRVQYGSMEQFIQLLRGPLSTLEPWVIDQILEEELDWPQVLLLHRTIGMGRITIDQAARILCRDSLQQYNNDLKLAVLEWLHQNLRHVFPLCRYIQFHRKEFDMENAYIDIRQGKKGNRMGWYLEMKFQKRGESPSSFARTWGGELEVLEEAVGRLLMTFARFSSAFDDLRLGHQFELRKLEVAARITAKEQRRSTRRKRR